MLKIKHISILFIPAFLIGAGGLHYFTQSRVVSVDKNIKAEIKEESQFKLPPPSPYTVKLKKEPEPKDIPAKAVFVGDVMLDRYVDVAFKIRGAEIFSGTGKLVEDADLFVFNHEGTFPDVDRPQDLQSLLFSFRPGVLEAFQASVGVPIAAGLANNHSYNFGESIYRQTRANLKGADFDIFGSPGGGTPEELMLKKEVNGHTLVLYGYNQFGGSREQITELIGANSKQDQLDIVYAHWGNEYIQAPSSYQKETARNFIDAGADIVIGHHPHIVQPYEKIADSVVFYSLGNFIFDQYFRESTQYGLALRVIVDKDSAKIIPTPVSLYKSTPKVEDDTILSDVALFPGFDNIDTIELINF